MCLRKTFLLSVLLFTRSVIAADLIESTTGFNINHTPLLQHNSISVGGWVSAGISYSTDDPDHHNTSPVTFNDRSGEFQVNQLNLFAQKFIDMDSESWDYGGRFDILYGTDARYTQATGLDDELISEKDFRFYDLSIPQAYVELFSPIGNGLTAKIGHFYTIIGYEVVNAPDNFFYSHAYTMQYGEPFTHTGVLFSYPLNNNFSINAGVVNGWDNFDENLGNWNFIGNVAWSDDDETSSVVLSLITGDTDDVSSKNRTMYSLVATHHFDEKLHYIFQHDFGFQEQAAVNNQDAYWYGVNQYLFYDVNDSISVGVRAEWFRDDGDSRLNIGASGSYFAISTGLNWSPQPWLKIRPEIRYDWVDADAQAYDNQTESNQLLFSMDMVVTL